MKMADILGPDGLAVPESQSTKALARLQGLSKHVAIQSNVALAGTEAETVEPDCRPRLRLQRLDQGLQAEMVVVPLGGPSQRAFSPGVGNVHLVESVGDKTLQTHRNLKQEADLAQRALEVATVLNDLPSENYTWTFDDPLDALELLEQLQAVPAEVLTVEWPKGDPITVRSISAQQFHLSIHSAQDWFEVEGEVQVDQGLLIKMRTLLDQIESSDSPFIALGKDQYIALSRQLRKQLQWLSAGGAIRRQGRHPADAPAGGHRPGAMEGRDRPIPGGCGLRRPHRAASQGRVLSTGGPLDAPGDPASLSGRRLHLAGPAGRVGRRGLSGRRHGLGQDRRGPGPDPSSGLAGADPGGGAHQRLCQLGLRGPALRAHPAAGPLRHRRPRPARPGPQGPRTVRSGDLLVHAAPAGSGGPQGRATSPRSSWTRPRRSRTPPRSGPPPR